MRNPFRRQPPPEMPFWADPFWIEQQEARQNAKIAEMGAAETRLNSAINRANKATGDANTARGKLDASIGSAGRQARRSGNTW